MTSEKQAFCYGRAETSKYGTRFCRVLKSMGIEGIQHLNEFTQQDIRKVLVLDILGNQI